MLGFAPQGQVAIAEGRLKAGTSVGSGSLSLNAASFAGAFLGFVAIDPFTPDCEIRRIDGVNNAAKTIQVAALTYAHAAGDRLIFFQGDEIPITWFGAVFDGSTNGAGTNNEPAIQRALNEAGRYGLTLDCLVGTYALALPVVMPPSPVLLRRFTFVPASGYPLVGASFKDSPLLSNRQGGTQTFTVSAAGDVFTTPLAHGMPNNIGVMFKEVTGAGGITPGRVYYTRDVTATTFKVSATRTKEVSTPYFLSDAAVNITTDGAGVVQQEVLSLQRVNIKDGYIYGRDIDIVGAAFSAQQPSFFENFRIDACDRACLVLGGQEAKFEGLMVNYSPFGLELENATIMRFTSLNSEGCNRGVHVRSDAQASMFGQGGGGGSSFFKGCHFENQSGGSDAKDFDVEGGFGTVTIDDSITSLNLATQKFFHSHIGLGEASAATYIIRSVWFAGASGVNVGAIQDDDRTSVPDRSATDYGRLITEVWNGRSGVNKFGQIFTNALLPADSEVATGDVVFAVDPTPGSTRVRFKAKDSNGVVRTGAVNLT